MQRQKPINIIQRIEYKYLFHRIAMPNIRNSMLMDSYMLHVEQYIYKLKFGYHKKRSIFLM